MVIGLRWLCELAEAVCLMGLGDAFVYGAPLRSFSSCSERASCSFIVGFMSTHVRVFCDC